MPRSRSFRVRGATLGVVLACVVGVFSAAPATAGSSRGSTGNSNPNTYLALGDSVTFGYDPLLVQPGGDRVDPEVFVGFPQLVAWRSSPKLKLVNASCPGETSTGFITGAAADDFRCQFYRQSIGDLHVSYEGSQLQFATSYLAAHPRTNVVSLMIGANDLLKLQSTCTQTNPATVNDCIASGLPALLTRLQMNLMTIYTALRDTGFTARFVALTYYSPNYTDVPFTNAARAVNDVLTQVAEAFDGTVADTFTAFDKAAAPYGGDTCATGLLIHLTPTSCDIHTSPAGDRLLASTFLSAVKHARSQDSPRAA
ncbi:MAG: GDSL-type esterase/lipase family protein [Dermatophilaceae bacterium]